MPYYITDKHNDCSGWAVVKADGELVSCQKTKTAAIKNAVAISLSEKVKFMGELDKRAVDTYTPPQGVRSAAKRALKWIEEGKAGQGFTAVGRRRATQLANGEPVSLQTVNRMRSYFARHTVDKESIGFNSGEEGYPTPGRVAWDAWGGDAGKSWVNGLNTERTIRAGEQEIVICDIDGTLINGGRLVNRVYDYARSQPGSLFIVTGRPESDRADTESELRSLGVRYSRLIMNDGSTADSVTYKKETAKRLLETYKVVMAIENNEAARNAYSDLGITAVNPSSIPEQRNGVEEYALLNERQQSQADDIAELATEYGQFNQGTGADGAHYAPADKNPFKADGLVCRNCVFFNEATNQCQVVEGEIEPEAICKLWVIPESSLTAPESEPVMEMNNAKWLNAAYAIKAKLEGGTPEARALGGREIRTVQSELRALEDGMTFEGYAAVFNSPSEPLPFTELIAPGAFTRSLKSRNRMMLLWNHNTDEPLASNRNGSLQLTQDERGLKVRAKLPDTTRGRDIAELVRTGVIDSMSFGFTVRKDSWSADGSTRTLHDVTLFEVSVVSAPAYEGTAGTTFIRSTEQRDLDPNLLAESLAKLESGDELSDEQATTIREVVNKLSKVDEPQVETEPTVVTDLIALHKAKIALLEKLA